MGLRGRSQQTLMAWGVLLGHAPPTAGTFPGAPLDPGPQLAPGPGCQPCWGNEAGCQVAWGGGGLFTTLRWPECPVSQWHRQGGGAPHPHHPPRAFPTAGVFPVPHVPLKQRIYPLSLSTDPAGLGLEAGGERKPTAAQNREGTGQRCPGSQPTVGVLPSREAFCKRGAGQK